MKVFLCAIILLLNSSFAQSVEIGKWGTNPSVTPLGNYLPTKLKLRPCIDGQKIFPCRYYNLSLNEGAYSKTEFELRNKCSYGNASACLELSLLYVKLIKDFGLNLKSQAFNYVELACFHGLMEACRMGVEYPRSLVFSINDFETDRSINLGRLACELEHSEAFCTEFEGTIKEYCKNEKNSDFSLHCKMRKDAYTCQTDKHFISIGISGSEINYKSWKSAADASRTPDLEIKKGNHLITTDINDPKCSMNKFIFKNSNYSYEVHLPSCNEKQPKGTLKVYKGESLLKQWSCT